MNNKKYKKVILKSFLGTKKPKGKVASSENYWQLIGNEGLIIDEDRSSNKVLVLFKCSLDDLLLENHNEIKNSLWLRESDLAILSDADLWSPTFINNN